MLECSTKRVLRSQCLNAQREREIRMEGRCENVVDSEEKWSEDADRSSKCHHHTATMKVENTMKKVKAIVKCFDGSFSIRLTIRHESSHPDDNDVEEY
ncbi:hypothetical protein ACSQ67_008988 [Phaseolus vulgaris]